MFARIARLLARAAADRRGGTIIEYCLIAGIISVTVVGGASILGENANNTFTNLTAEVWGN
jgi:pilus assembly protein Flp/PilA